MVNQSSDTTAPIVLQHCSSDAHYWLIGRPDGPTSEGVCKWCNAHRDFTNEVSRRYSGQGRPPQASTVSQVARPT